MTRLVAALVVGVLFLPAALTTDAAAHGSDHAHHDVAAPDIVTDNARENPGPPAPGRLPVVPTGPADDPCCCPALAAGGACHAVSATGPGDAPSPGLSDGVASSGPDASRLPRSLSNAPPNPPPIIADS